MGHGASTNTKKIKIEANDVFGPNDVVWNRSNSDGCIVETLNSSRTKVDLLEQQVDEYRDLLQLAEENYGKVHKKAERFEKQLAEAESAKLELMDRMEDLEDELSNLQSQVESDSAQELTRVIQEKHQEIESLQANVEKLSRDIKIVKSKCKERLKSMKSKLVESKQDYSMQLYQMKEELRIMEEENKKLLENIKPSSDSLCSDKSGHVHTKDKADSPGDPRNHLIVELSNQVSQQELLIVELKEKLRIKDDLLKSKSVSTSRSGTRSFSAGDKGRTADANGRSVSKNRDHCNVHGEINERLTNDGSSRGKTSRLKSGLVSESNVSHRSKPTELENETQVKGRSPSRSPGLASTKDKKSKLFIGGTEQEIDKLFSHPEDGVRLSNRELDGHLEDGDEWSDVDISPPTDGHSKSSVHSAHLDTTNDEIYTDISSPTDGHSKSSVHSDSAHLVSSRESSGKSSHRMKRQQMKSRKLSPLVRANHADGLSGSPLCLHAVRDVDSVSIESGILSLDSYAT